MTDNGEMGNRNSNTVDGDSSADQTMNSNNHPNDHAADNVNHNGNNSNNNSEEHKDGAGMDAAKELRRKIVAINANPDLDAKEKAKRMQSLLAGKWGDSPTQPPLHANSEKSASYFKEEENLYGCKHYRRNCKLKAACCDKLVVCRFCHDETTDHQINRFATQEIMCMICFVVQPISNACITPSCNGAPFAKYFCPTCKFYDDDPNKDIYHCEQCGICRIGKGLEIDFRHCTKCNACLALQSFSEHRCIENKLSSDCPICNQNMFYSTLPLSIMPCGHGIHKTCLKEYFRRSYRCPLCSKSLTDMSQYWRNMDRDIAGQPMPAEFNTLIANIHCNDCEKRDRVKFHFAGNRCSICNGYNTVVISRETGTQQEIDELLAAHPPILPGHEGVGADEPQLVMIMDANANGNAEDEDDDEDDDDDEDEDDDDEPMDAVDEDDNVVEE